MFDTKQNPLTKNSGKVLKLKPQGQILDILHEVSYREA